MRGPPAHEQLLIRQHVEADGDLPREGSEEIPGHYLPFDGSRAHDYPPRSGLDEGRDFLG